MRRLDSRAMRSVIASVRSRVEPFAPYVTDTKSGASGAKVSSVCQSRSASSGVLGGKNSNEYVGSSRPQQVGDRRIVLRCHEAQP